MSAATLRNAAALMRSRAEGATPGLWEVRRDEDSGGLAVYGAARHLCDVSEWSRWLGNADHIASWPPVVAMAVADWMDATARELDALGDPDLSTHPQDGRRTAALAVATAYLGQIP